MQEEQMIIGNDYIITHRIYNLLLYKGRLKLDNIDEDYDADDDYIMDGICYKKKMKKICDRRRKSRRIKKKSLKKKSSRRK